MRRTATIKITDEGRDKGKTFIVTEMSSADGEDWAIQAFFALANAGMEFPDEVAQGGFAGIAAVGYQALMKLPYEAAKPLLDKMMTCVQYQHDPKHPLQPIYEGDACQIEEIKTRLLLRMEVFKLHTLFLKSDATPVSELGRKSA